MPTSTRSTKTTRPAAGASPAARVRAYFAAQPVATRRVLTQLREIITTTMPAAEEAFSYGIPGFRLHGRPFLWYAGWAAHCSVYPITAGIRTAYAERLAGYSTSKGTVRFPLDQPLPRGLVRTLVKARAAEMKPRAVKTTK
jgi:uncharacterized protein YdhG (YjbR/CyaY superfamily)